jgi:hypothetical protein
MQHRLPVTKPHTSLGLISEALLFLIGDVLMMFSGFLAKRADRRG